MSNQAGASGPKHQLTIEHPLFNVLAPLQRKMAEMTVNARTPETIAKKQWRKHEIVKRKGLLHSQEHKKLSNSL